jgi:hypothetical protein
MLQDSEIQEIVEKQIKPITKEIKSWNYSSINVEHILGIYEMRAEYFEIKRGFKPALFVEIIETCQNTKDLYFYMVSFNFVDGDVGFAFIRFDKSFYFTGALIERRDKYGLV